MEERGTGGEFLSMHPTPPAWETDFTTQNENEELYLLYFSKKIQILKLLTLTISLVGLAGNATVLWVLGFRMHRKAFCVYILNLAAADFLFLCCHIIDILLYFTMLFYSVSISSYIYTFFVPLWIFTYIASLSMLSAISTERCLSVLWPIWYRCHRPRHISAVMCALLWVLSLLLSILEGYHCNSEFKDFEFDWCRAFDFFTAAWLIFLFVVLSGSSLALLVRIFRSSRQRLMTRLYVTILLIVVVFLFCGLPFGIRSFLVTWFRTDFEIFLSYPVSSLMSSVNSCANPIIYFLIGSFRQRLRQRQTLQLVLQRALRDAPEEDECGDSHSQEVLEMSGSRVRQ